MIHDKIFENIDDVVNFLNDTGWNMNKCYMGNAPYEVISYGKNKTVYYPQPIGTPLFRGQNEFYEPCISSFFRFQPDNITQFIQKLKLEEFRIVTSEHPVIKEEIKNGISYDYVALAQHYEFQTEMLDITNSLSVAAFFAVTRKESDKYVPMEKSDKPGVLYFVTPEMQFIGNEDEPKFRPVGWQVFKRPAEQRAFGVKVSKNEDFNTMSGVFAYRFWQDKKISNKIYDMFNGGETLFPRDIFAEKVSVIKDSKIFSMQAFILAYQNSDKILNMNMILAELKKRNIEIQINSIFKYSSADLTYLKELSLSGKLTENLHATTRLCYFPDINQRK